MKRKKKLKRDEDPREFLDSLQTKIIVTSIVYVAAILFALTLVWLILK